MPREHRHPLYAFIALFVVCAVMMAAEMARGGAEVTAARPEASCGWASRLVLVGCLSELRDDRDFAGFVIGSEGQLADHVAHGP